jgi:hypothetical protein
MATKKDRKPLRTPIELQSEVEARTADLRAANERLRQEIAARQENELRMRLALEASGAATASPLNVTIERSWITTPGPVLPLTVAANRAAEASRTRTPAPPFPEIEPVKSIVELNCASAPTLELFVMTTAMAATVSRAMLIP